MTLVDSSVWIDYFNGITSRETDMLDRLLREERLAIGDLILAEVLQGFSSDRQFREAHKMLSSLVMIDLGGKEVAVQAARNFRTLRKLGVTVRETIHTLIATRCIESGLTLLSSDRDFDPFVRHLGLRTC